MTISSTETPRPTTESMVTAAIPSGLKRISRKPYNVAGDEERLFRIARRELAA
jgi:hypothetical protein